MQKSASLLIHAEGMVHKGKLSGWLIAKTCNTVVQQFLDPMCDDVLCSSQTSGLQVLAEHALEVS